MSPIKTKIKQIDKLNNKTLWFYYLIRGYTDIGELGLSLPIILCK